MGVDFYACNYCGDTFPNAGHFVSCECGQRWCSDDCAEADGRRYEADGFTPKNSRYAHESSCNYCREEDYEDYQLLETALELLGKTRLEVIAIRKEVLDNKCKR